MANDGDGGSGIGPAVATHELQNPDRTTAHRMVTVGMLTTALVVAISMDWWKHAEEWLYVNTHDSKVLQGSPPQITAEQEAAIFKWIIGIGGMWIVLSLMVDLGDTADLAVAIALVTAGSVVLTRGPDVFTSLGISTQAPK